MICVVAQLGRRGSQDGPKAEDLGITLHTRNCIVLSEVFVANSLCVSNYNYMLLIARD